VAKGRIPGIYTSWPITQSQVHGFSGALFQGFHDYTEAQHFLYVYATNLSTNDRQYLGQTLGLTTNVNVHINTSPAPPQASQDSTPSTQATNSQATDSQATDSTPDPYDVPHSQATDSQATGSTSDLYDDPNTTTDTNEAILELNNDDDN
jgi:hypothetical protein